MSATSDVVLAIGLGNPLLGDDGVGPRIIDELRQLRQREPGALPPGTRLVAAGAPSLDLLHVIGDAGALLLVDAIDRGDSPGSAVVFRGAAVSTTVAGEAIGELLTAARLIDRLPGSTVLIGIQVGMLGARVGLSPAIEAAVPANVALVERELSGLAGRALAGGVQVKGATP